MGLEHSLTVCPGRGILHLVLGQAIWLPFVLQILSMFLTVLCRESILSVLLSVIVVFVMAFVPIYPGGASLAIRLMATGQMDGEFASLALVVMVLATALMAWCGQRAFSSHLTGDTPFWRPRFPARGIRPAAMGEIQ